MRSKRIRWLATLLFVMAVSMLLIKYKSVVVTGVRPVFRLIESQRISGKITGYEMLEDNDFTIRYKAEDGDAARKIKDIADSWGSKVLSFFEYEDPDPVSIVVFSQESELKSALRIPQEQSATGAYAGGRLNLLSPDGLAGLDQSPDSLVNVYVHELTHLIIDDMAKGNYPLWFTEGSALYMEYELLGYEWGLGITDDHVYTIDDLAKRFYALDEQMAYRQSFLAVKGLIHDYGEDKYLLLLRRLGSGADFNDALEEVYGVSQKNLEKYLNK